MFLKILSMCTCLFFASTASATAPADESNSNKDVAQYESNAPEIARHLMRKAPRCEIVKNDDYRAELSRDIVQVASEYQIPHELFVVVLYRESSLGANKKDGKKGEKGIGQVKDPKHWGCDMSTRIGQLRCSAKVFRFGYDKCGTWSGALSAYQSRGAKCRPIKGSYHAHQVKSRINQWVRIRRRFPV